MKEYIQPDAPAVVLPVIRGERYEATVPDTFDVAERSRLALRGLTGPLDAQDDYALYWVVGYGNNPPVMKKEQFPHLQTKFMEAMRLLRLITGEVDDRGWSRSG